MKTLIAVSLLFVSSQCLGDIITYNFDGHIVDGSYGNANPGSLVTGSFQINTEGENFANSDTQSHYAALENTVFVIDTTPFIQTVQPFDISMTRWGISASYTPINSGPTDNTDSQLDMEFTSLDPSQSLAKASHLESESFLSRTWALIEQTGSGFANGVFDHISQGTQVVYNGLGGCSE